MPLYLEVKELLADNDFRVALLSTCIILLVTVPNIVLAVIRFRDENTIHRRAEQALKRLIKSNGSPFVTFRVICHHIGGFPDDELRRMLVRAGAVRFADPNRVEHWALLSSLSRRQRANLSSITLPASNAPPSVELFPTSQKVASE